MFQHIFTGTRTLQHGALTFHFSDKLAAWLVAPLLLCKKPLAHFLVFANVDFLRCGIRTRAMPISMGLYAAAIPLVRLERGARGGDAHLRRKSRPKQPPGQRCVTQIKHHHPTPAAGNPVTAQLPLEFRLYSGYPSGQSAYPSVEMNLH